MMRLPDERLDPGVRDCPQHARGLRDGEGEVEARHSTPCAAGSLLGNDLRDSLALGPRRQRLAKSGDPRLDPLVLALVRREAQAELVTCDRITSRAHQELELVF